MGYFKFSTEALLHFDALLLHTISHLKIFVGGPIDLVNARLDQFVELAFDPTPATVFDMMHLLSLCSRGVRPTLVTRIANLHLLTMLILRREWR